LNIKFLVRQVDIQVFGLDRYPVRDGPLRSGAEGITHGRTVQSLANRAKSKITRFKPANGQTTGYEKQEIFMDQASPGPQGCQPIEVNR
jgi:hypothetical protein